MATDSKKLKGTKIPGVYEQPDGKYLIRVSVWVDGKPKQAKRVMASGTKPDDLKRAVLDLKADAKGPKILTPRRQDTSQTLEDYANLWGSTRYHRLAPSTATTYEISLRQHILPRLGWMKCKDITRGAIEGWVVWAEQQQKTIERRTPVRDEKGKIVRDKTTDADKFGHYKMIMNVETVTEPYAQDTMRQWWRTLKAMMADMAADLALPDPTGRVRPPERPQQALKREQRTVELDSLSVVLEAAKLHTPDRYAEIACLALTGMRSGELYALKWDCVDFGKGQIVVRRAVSKGVIRDITKTKRQRTVPIHPLVVGLLKTHEEQQVADQAIEIATGLLFPSDKGADRPRTPNTLRKAFGAIKEATGIEVKIGPQVLRRSMNTNLVRQNVDRLTLRAIMGHTSEQMTGRYYGASEGDKMAAVLLLPVDAAHEPE